MGAHRYLDPKYLHAPWYGDRRNNTHKCQNGKIVHTHLGVAPYEWALPFPHVVCESWAPICINYIPYLVP